MRRPAEPVIEVIGLRVERDAVVLERVDWRVEAGENWVILGANGSGKTSLLSALAGYLPPTAGTIRVLGETYGAADWRRLRTRVGMVSSALDRMMPEHETALDTIASGKRAMIGLWGETEAEDRARALEMLRLAEVEYVVERPWRILSQGERQRVMIGRALMAKPELLILDEPCAGLDPVAREQFLHFLSRLAHSRKALTLVLVTHHIEEIVPGFSRVLVLKNGRVVGAGPTERMIKSQILSEAFGARVVPTRRDGRYLLSVTPRRSKVT